MPIKSSTDNRFFFKKSLGQNILKDKNIIRRIISSIKIQDDDVVLEIGPGLGALTDRLAGLKNDIIALEKDDRFAEILSKRYREQNVKIIRGDALIFDYGRLLNEYGKKMKVVANLPYNVSTQILLKLFSKKECFKSLILMFQKEVADRITANPSCKDYGILSVISRYHSEVKALFAIPRRCFVPAPKVDSAVVRFDILDEPVYKVKDENLLFKVVKTAFSKRRKTLLNCFKGFEYDSAHDIDIKEAFALAGIDHSRRGETLSVEEFASLTNTFFDLRKPLCSD